MGAPVGTPPSARILRRKPAARVGTAAEQRLLEAPEETAAGDTAQAAEPELRAVMGAAMAARLRSVAEAAADSERRVEMAPLLAVALGVTAARA